MTLAEQLTEFYLNYETTHRQKLTREEAIKYHQKLLDLGNIITVSDGDILCGYVEFWRLTFEQFGRIICGEPFSAFNEDVQTGYIAYVGDVYIRPSYRRGSVIKMLRNRFVEANRACTFFVGEAKRKKSAPVKVFRRSEIDEWRKKD